jgi:hypothetical protein
LKSLMICLTLGVMPAIGGGGVAHVAPVTLYTQFQQDPPAPMVQALQNELAAIMAPTGLLFSWHSLSEAGGQVSSQLAIIHFKGECDTQQLRQETGFPGPLGWTHISDGEILPFIDVNCDGLRIFVQRELSGVGAAERETVFGRAAARILAHELYHLLANTRSHTSGGIGKAAYSVQELLAPVLHFGKKECDSLRGFKERLAAQSAEGE